MLCILNVTTGSVCVLFSPVPRNVISTWSSGTGGAGIAGSLSYAVMIGAGLTPKTTLLLMLIAPVLEAIAFWGILRHNNHIHVDENSSSSKRPSTVTNGSSAGTNSRDQVSEKAGADMEQSYPSDGSELEPLTGFKSKMRYVPKLLIYMVPLTLVYLLEYFINQGLVIRFAWEMVNICSSPVLTAAGTFCLSIIHKHT